MRGIIKKDILSILRRVMDALQRKDLASLAEISNHINHNSSIFQDEDSIQIAVLVYALSKVLRSKKGKKVQRFYGLFRKARESLYKDEIERYRAVIKRIIYHIKEIDSKMQEFVLQVYGQAGIKKGSKLYYNGITIPRVAELLGLSQWELLNYIGKTNIPDTFDKDRKIRERIKYARSLFRISGRKG